MITRYRAWLDGEGLHDIDPAIIITDIQESIPDMTIATSARAKGDGLRILRKTRRSISVALRFVIHEYDVERRKSILQKVLTWAGKGGLLTINDRPEQQLSVVVDQIPIIASSLRWLNEMMIVFKAYDFPYWQSQYPATATISGKSGSARILPDGNCESCVLEAKITNVSANTLNAIELSANGMKISFNGLGIASGKTFEMTFSDGFLSLPVAKRTPESADEILLKCGQYNTVALSADQNVSAIFYARGAWM